MCTEVKNTNSDQTSSGVEMVKDCNKMKEQFYVHNYVSNILSMMHKLIIMYNNNSYVIYEHALCTITLNNGHIRLLLICDPQHCIGMTFFLDETLQAVLWISHNKMRVC
jgi:hypothetical protein